nr:uncharacterized protein LOC112211256 isoform X1 [Halyomorpha halys]
MLEANKRISMVFIYGQQWILLNIKCENELQLLRPRAVQLKLGVAYRYIGEPKNHQQYSLHKQTVTTCLTSKLSSSSPLWWSPLTPKKVPGRRSRSLLVPTTTAPTGQANTTSGNSHQFLELSQTVLQFAAQFPLLFQPQSQPLPPPTTTPISSKMFPLDRDTTINLSAFHSQDQ